jgi:hypothetical protein
MAAAVLDADPIRVHMSASRHLAESLGRFALPLTGTQTFLQTSINRRRRRSFDLTRTVKKGYLCA